MAFLCPSQLNIKKKVLHGKTPLPDSYKANGKTDNTNALEHKSALKSPSSSNSSTHKPEQRTVRINEGGTGIKHETLVERKIKAATLARPANLRVKIIHDFSSTDQEELGIRKGQFVKVLYQHHDWLYVVDSSGNEGFVPYAYCSTLNASTDSKSSTSGYEDSFEGSDELEKAAERRKLERVGKRDKHKRRSKTDTSTTYFPKRPYGPKLTVLYDFKARYENDVSVARGEFVMLLNDQDPDWLWIATEDGEEGFIPRSFVISHACEGCRKKLAKDTTPTSPYINGDMNASDVTATSSSSVDKKSRESSCTDVTSSDSSDKKYELKGAKLISLYEYEGTAFDDLSVHAGEYVYANLKDQIVPGWIWAYSPYRRRSGFIPEEYLKEPVVTDI